MEALAFSNFSFAYATHPSRFVLRGVDLRIERGEFALLQGGTGSGKTTLLRCAVPALLPAGERKGEVRLRGQALDWPGCSRRVGDAHADVHADALATGLADVHADGAVTRFGDAAFGKADVDEHAFAADGAGEGGSGIDVGYVGQHPAEQIVCDSVWHELAFGCENLGMSPGQMRRRVAEVAHYFGMEPWLHSATDELSGGQQQLLNLASVLCMRPKLILLDEPTAQLDPVAAADFVAALGRVWHDTATTVVVATHAPWEWDAYATCAYRIVDGVVRGVGRDACSARISDEGLLRPGDGWQCAPAPSESAGAKPFVGLEDAFFRYGRDLPWVLRGCNLDVAQGEVHALIGGNGSGKTTVLYALAGVLRLARGTVHNLSSAQALLPQDPKLLMACDTVRDEFAEWQDACGYAEEKVAEVVERFGFAEVLDTHPFDVSGGQLQLIGLAKLVLSSPDLLLLDEPTKGLDATSTATLLRVLAELRAQGTTVVVATHDLAFALALADQATMLFDGQDAHAASPSSLFEGNLFYRPHPSAVHALYVALGVEGEYAALGAESEVRKGAFAKSGVPSTGSSARGGLEEARGDACLCRGESLP